MTKEKYSTLETSEYRLIDRETREVSDIVHLTDKEYDEAKNESVYIILKASSITTIKN